LNIDIVLSLFFHLRTPAQLWQLRCKAQVVIFTVSVYLFFTQNLITVMPCSASCVCSAWLLSTVESVQFI